jgi:hypothetical protein
MKKAQAKEENIRNSPKQQENMSACIIRATIILLLQTQQPLNSEIHIYIYMYLFLI